jgi:ankyrin repeat protein
MSARYRYLQVLALVLTTALMFDISLNETPLHFASRKNSLEIVKMLLEAGADLHAQV